MATTGPWPDPREIEKIQSAPPRPAPVLLTDEQIDLIKVYEIDLNEKPRVIVPRETIAQLSYNDVRSYLGTICPVIRIAYLSSASEVV